MTVIILYYTYTLQLIKKSLRVGYDDDIKYYIYIPTLK